MTLSLIRKPVSTELANSRLDMFGIVPDRLLGLDVESIGQLNVVLDAQTHALRDHFSIVDGSRDTLVIKGDLSKADRVGGGMLAGTLVIESDVGLGLAEQMRGGLLNVSGDADDYACSQLRGGRVRIAGNVGDYCAAAGPGMRRGMRGGSCLVAGNAGRYLGYRMRRGFVHVEGNVAEGCASSLIAGSVLISGRAAAPFGVGMRRGSVLLLHPDPPEMQIGFTPLEPVSLSYLPLLLNETDPSFASQYRQRASTGYWQRSLGDRASGGMGEIMWLRPKDDERMHS